MDNKYRIAVASSDGIVVNQHFGKAADFLIYEVSQDDGETSEPVLIEKRTSEPVCQSGEHDDNKLKQSAEALSDCHYVLVSRIGPGAAAALEAEGISPMELPGMIDESIKKLLGYIELQNLLL